MISKPWETQPGYWGTVFNIIILPHSKWDDLARPQNRTLAVCCNDSTDIRSEPNKTNDLNSADMHTSIQLNELRVAKPGTAITLKKNYRAWHCSARHLRLIPHHFTDFSLVEKGKKQQRVVGGRRSKERRNVCVGWKGYKNRGRI